MALSDQIRKAREAQELTQAALAARVGISQPAIRKIESGETANSRWLPAILAALGMTEEIGKIKVPTPTLVKDSFLELDDFAAKQQRMPIWGRDIAVEPQQANHRGVSDSNAEPLDYVDIPWFCRVARKPFGIILEDESMSPVYELEDIVICNPSLTIVRNKNCLLSSLRNENRRYTRLRVFRLLDWTDTTWSVRQFNPPCDLTLDKAEWPVAVRIAGKVEA